MRRLNLFIILTITSVITAYSQDYWHEYQERAATATPIKEIYIWADYQQTFPMFHATYYHLGRLSYSLIPYEHPIRDYHQLNLYLYNTKLYFGNLLHYAQGQTLKSRYYPGLPSENKVVSYATLAHYARTRMDTAATIKQAVDSIYHCYNRLVERYTLCRLIYTDFTTRYTHEKTAHLYLTDADKTNLQQLIDEIEQLPQDIELFRSALALHPIEGYNPQFRQVPIALYHLDGLTNSNFLENDIPLWDYATWAKGFLELHNTVYTAYFDAIDRNIASRESDELLLNRIDRLDYNSWMKAWLGSGQLAEQVNHVNYIDLPQIYDLYRMQCRAEQFNASVLSQLNDDGLLRYATVLQSRNLYDIPALKRVAQTNLTSVQNAYTNACIRFSESIPHIPFVSYVDSITETVFTADSLHFTFPAELVQILPIGENRMAVFANGEVAVANAQGNLIIMNKPAALTGAQRIFTARKLSANTIALIARDRIIWIDKKAQLISAP